MGQFYLLDYLGGTRGAPHYIDGVVEEWSASPWHEQAPDSVERYLGEEPMNLRTKHRQVEIEFDYAYKHQLFIASDVFLERLEGAACEYVSRPLRVWAAKNKECTHKKWFLIRVQNRYWCMDRDRSEYKVARDKETGQLRLSKFPEDIGRNVVVIDKVYKLAIEADKTEGKDLFFCQEAHRHIVTERLASRLEGLVGVRLTPTEEYKFPLTGEKVVDRG